MPDEVAALRDAGNDPEAQRKVLTAVDQAATETLSTDDLGAIAVKL
jgi:hypothetical protein